jgi:predicted HD superfamily hydrolase involved in NAD metabolism
MDYTAIEREVRELVSPERMHHIKGTVHTSTKLAERFSLSEDEAATAALWHDAARHWSREKLLSFISADVLGLELREPVLLHAPAGAQLFLSSRHSHRFTPVQRERIYNAIRWHTLANAQMGELGYVLFIADYAEPGRRHLSPEDREHLFALPSLEQMMLHVLQGQFAHFARIGLTDIAPETAQLYERLKQEYS